MTISVEGRPSDEIFQQTRQKGLLLHQRYVHRHLKCLVLPPFAEPPQHIFGRHHPRLTATPSSGHLEARMDLRKGLQCHAIRNRCFPLCCNSQHWPSHLRLHDGNKSRPALPTFLRHTSSNQFHGPIPSRSLQSQVSRAHLSFDFLRFTHANRWLADPSFDITKTQAVSIGRKTSADEAVVVSPQPLPSLHRPASPAPNTRTLPPKLIHHQAMTKFKDVLCYIRTEEELQDLSADIEALV